MRPTENTVGIDGVTILPLEKASWYDTLYDESIFKKWCDGGIINQFSDPTLKKFNVAKQMLDDGMALVFIDMSKLGCSDEIQMHRAKLIYNILKVSRLGDPIIFLGNIRTETRERNNLGLLFLDFKKDLENVSEVFHAALLHRSKYISSEIASAKNTTARENLVIISILWINIRDMIFEKTSGSKLVYRKERPRSF